MIRAKWEEVSRAKDEMFAHTDLDESPWFVVEADVKRHARLNMIAHLLSSIPYHAPHRALVELPPRPPARSTATACAALPVRAGPRRLTGGVRVPSGHRPRQRPVQAARRLRQRHRERPVHLERVAAGLAERGERTPWRSASLLSRAASPLATVTRTRAADSANSPTNGSPGTVTVTPTPCPQPGLGQRLRQPAVGEVVGAGDYADRVAQQLARRSAARSTRGGTRRGDRARRSPTRSLTAPRGSRRAGRPARPRRSRRTAYDGDVLHHAEHGDHRGGQDRRLAGLVVEADVPAGDRDAELEAGVLEAAAGLRELPHDVGVLGEPKFRQSEIASGVAPPVATLR